MSRPILELHAGARALANIRKHGLQANDVDVLVGASGGPKWFCLYGIDQYLLKEFFAGRDKPLELLGSSAGGWRFACYAQQEGAAASTRFCQAYRTLCYPPKADIRTVTEISRTVLDAIFPTTEHIQQVLNHPFYRLNLIVAGKTGQPLPARRWRQLSHLTLTATANLLDRRLLGHFYHRLQFCHPASQLQAPNDLPTCRIELTQASLPKALLATGSIPLVLETVRDIPGLSYADYVDGGLTDYHFGWPIETPGLVLFPHFYQSLSPGWFDKALRWRHLAPARRDNLVLLCPSADWVQSLPYQKIPDRSDFSRFTDTERLRYWQEVTERSFELAAALQSQHFSQHPL